MKVKAVSGIMLTLLLIGMLPLAFSFQLVKAGAGTTLYPWTMFGHDLRRTGFSLSPAPSTNDMLWTFETGDSIVSSPAVNNGKVFIGSMDKKIYALDQFSGNLIWSSLLDNFIFISSPAVDSNKVLITAGDELFALDEITGAIIWSQDLGNIADFSSPAVVDGMVFVCSFSDGPMGNVFALDENNGTIIWSYSDRTEFWSSPAIADGMVFVSSMVSSVHGVPGKVFALNQSNGELIWATEMIDSGAFISSPAVSKGRVFVGGVDGYLYALDEYTGSILWKQLVRADGAVYSSPAVAYGRVFIGSYDGKIYALDENNGDIVWTFQTEDRIESSSPAVADGKVFVGSDDCNVYALNATTGAKIWNYTTGGWVWSSPTVADGVVYVGSLDGKIYAFGHPPTVSATIDLEPNTLNLRSKRRCITCYIELPEGYNVSDIDVSTVMLNDTIPLSLLDAPEPVLTEIGDHDNDTIPDLMVKFSGTMVSELILSKGITYGSVTLTITGEVAGTPFEGSDAIRII